VNKLYQTSTDPFSKQIDTAGSVWADARLIVELSDVLGGKPYRDTKVSVIFNGEFLFIRFVCTSDFIEAKMTKPNDPVWEEEAAEVFIQPPGLSNYYFEIDVNPLNTVTDLIVVNNNRQGSERVFNNVREWDCRGLETRVHVEGEMNRDNGCRYWIAEMKIPLFEMPRGDGKEGLCGEWKFNFFRIDRSGEKPQFQAWNPTGRINFHLQDKFMTVNLQNPAKAMILAAGFGSRLKELTKDTPKPLIEIAENYSVIDNVVTQITNAQIYDIAVNLHYKGDMIRSHLEAKFPDVNWSFFYETEILETGGGILNAREFFSSDFGIVINCDILSYIDLGECISEHRDSGSAASLVIKPVEKNERVLSYNIVNGLTAFYGSDGTVRFGMERFTSPDDLFGDYTGIMIFGKEFFDFMPDKDKFSVIDVFVGMVRQGKKVNVINSGTKYWRDMGTPERLETVRKDFSSFKPVNTDNGIRTIDMLFKGASDKAVYRINYKDAGKKPEVLTVSDNEQELKAWAEFSKFFENTGFKVPRVVNADSSTPMRWILMEDGGKRSLLDHFKEAEFDRNIIRDHVRKAVDLLLELSKIDRDKFPKEHCIRERFDLENIIFDLKYYNKYYLVPEKVKV
jgi:NDP-sugar pyrophosphorylase family protein